MKKIALFLILLFIPVVAGSYISISTTITSEIIENGSSLMEISIEQIGDESAYNIETEVISPEYIKIYGKMEIPRLDPGLTAWNTFNISFTRELSGGFFPVVARIKYEDANGHPFSIVSPYKLKMGEAAKSVVTGSVEKLEISKNEEAYLKVKINNPSEKTKEITIRIYLPREIESGMNQKIIALGPETETETSFKITNKNAIAGSNYYIPVSLEYDEEKHYTKFINGNISIVEKKGDFNLITILSSIFIILALIYIYLKGGIKK